MKITPEQYDKIQKVLPVPRGNVKISNIDFLNAIDRQKSRRIDDENPFGRGRGGLADYASFVARLESRRSRRTGTQGANSEAFLSQKDVVDGQGLRGRPLSQQGEKVWNEAGRSAEASRGSTVKSCINAAMKWSDTSGV